MGPKVYNPVSSVVSVFIYVVIANVLNFTSAAAGNGVSPFNLVVSVAFFVLWGWQLSSSLSSGNKFFAYFTIGYWLVALGFYWLTYFSITFEIGIFATLGMIGMLMLYIPLYPFVALVRYLLRLDYFLAFTVAFIPFFVILLFIFYRKCKKASAAKADEKLLDDLQNTDEV